MGDTELPPTAPGGTDRGACAAFDLVALTEGRLSEPDVERIMIHVDTCPSCTDVMAHLAAYERPTRCGRYELGRAIGEGGMGTVYVAWDPQLRRRVAVKLVKPEAASATMRERMLREARALARVSHPNVVAVYDAGDHGADFYIATELIEGDTLAVWQRERGPREIAQAWLQVARGLAAAHAEDVVHRDVKPDNCFVGRDGRVRIGDFGLARETTTEAPGAERVELIESPVTLNGQVAGTPAYMAPEQRRGIVDPRSDQFALAVSLTEALTGRRPAASEAPPVARLPSVEPIIARALRSDPDDRYPSMHVLAEALAGALAPPPRKRSWRWGLAIAGAATATAVAGLAVVGALRDPEPVCEATDDLWSATDRVRLAAVTPPNVLPRIDAWLAKWRGAVRANCVAEVEPEVRAARARCLTGHAAAVRARLGAWAERTDPRAAVEPLQRELDDLPEVAHCARDAWLPVAPSAGQAIRIAALRLRAKAASALPEAAELAAMTELLAAVRAVDHAAFTLEHAIALADLQDDGDSIATLRIAVGDAERLDDRATHARAMVALLPVLGRAGREAEASALAVSARAAIGRLGGDHALEASLDYTLGDLEEAERRTDAAIAAFERARVGFRAALGPGSFSEAMCLIELWGLYAANDATGGLALTLYQQASAMALPLGLPTPQITNDPKQRIAAALQLLDKIREQDTGPRSMMYAHWAVAGSARVAGDRALAREHYSEMLALAERHQLRFSHVASGYARLAWLELGGDPRRAVELARLGAALAESLRAEPEQAETLEILGHALVDAGQPRAAIEPLTHALKLHEKLTASSSIRGRTRFGLAKAMWPVDRRRAVDSAVSARSDLQAALDNATHALPSMRDAYESNLRKIEAWLAKHKP